MKVVRRKLRSGICRGRHIIITRTTKEGVFARYVGEKAEFYLAENLNNFKEIPIIDCKVGIVEFEALKHAVYVYHILAPTWKRIVDEKPGIIRFWAVNTGYLYIIPQLIKKRVLKKAPQVYIEIKERIYESKSKLQ